MSTILSTNEAITSVVIHGLYAYIGTNRGNLYRALLSSGAATLLKTYQDKITALSTDYSTLYITTDKGYLYSLSIAATSNTYGMYVPAGTVSQAAIQLGDKSSTVGSGIAVNAAPADGSGIAGIVKVYGDLGGVVPASAVDINAIESRFLIASDVSASSASIKAIRGHIRLHTGKLPVAATVAGVCGYLEADGTSVIGTGINAAVVAMLESSGGAVSGAANTILSAFAVHTTGSWSLTTARSTILHIDTPASFNSLLDMPSGAGFVVSELTGGTPLYLRVYINNKAYTIKADTTT